MKKLLVLLALIFTVTLVHAMHEKCGFNYCTTPLSEGDHMIIVAIDGQANGYYIGHEECFKNYNENASFKDKVFSIEKINKRKNSQCLGFNGLSNIIESILVKENQRKKEKKQREKEHEYEDRIQRAVENSYSNIEGSGHNISTFGIADGDMSLYARCIRK